MNTFAMKKKNPGGCSLGYYWENEDSVVEVDAGHVAELEALGNHEFYQVERPVVEAPEDAEDDEEELHPELERPETDLANAVEAASVTADKPAPRKRTAPKITE